MKSVLARFRNGWMLALAVAGVVLAVGVIVYGLSGGERLIPGSVASGAPAAGLQRVTPSSVLRMDFPAAMDADSVEEHMTKPEGLEGTGTWDGSSYFFDPAAELDMGQTYTFTVSAGAERADGAPLTKGLTFGFLVAGNPSVIARVPAPNGTEVPMTGRISIIFDRPMVPLAQVQGGKGAEIAASIPVSISPAVGGRWRWLGSSTLTFEPTAGLDPATVYTVTVPAGIATPSGDKTDAEYTWTFSTEIPRLMATVPAQGENAARLLGPKQGIEMIFNQEMDLVALKKGISVKNTVDGSAAPVTTAYGTRPEKKGSEKQVQDKRVVIVSPASSWAHGANLEFTIAPETRGAKGTLTFGSSVTMQFGSIGDFDAIGSRFEYGSVYATFTTPLDAETMEKHVSFKPAVEFTASVSDWGDGTELWVYPDGLKPSTKYTMTIDKSTKDKFGQTIVKPHTLEFTTPKLDPMATILSNGEFGIFERDKAPIFYLNGVNVSRLDVEFAPLTLQQFLDIRSQRRYNWNYRHDMTGYSGYKSWKLEMQNDLNSWQHVPFDVAEKAGTSLPGGLYAIAVQAPEYVDYMGMPILEYNFFALTNMAITLKYSGSHALVWVTDMKTGAPVSGANIGFHGDNGAKGPAGVTDKDGFYEVDLDLGAFGAEWEPPFIVTAEKGGDFAFVGNDWGNGIRAWEFGFTDDFWGPMQSQYRMDSFVYTDRPVYRGGDTVSFKGIMRLRDRKGVMTSPKEGSTATATVTDALGNEVSTQDLKFNAYGAFNGQVLLSEEGTRGDYTINVIPNGVDIGYGSAYASFQMLDYRKPEYRVDVTYGEENYFEGDTIKATIEGAYYFGMAMAGAQVTWRAETSDYYFNRYTDGWYSFSADDMWCWWGCTPETSSLTEGKGVLDAQGRLTISVPAPLKDKKLSQIVSIEADVTDPNNQIVSNRASVPVHKADIYAGIRNNDYVVEPGNEASFDIITVSPQGVPVGDTAVQVSLYSRTWNTVRKKGVDGQYYYDNTPEDVFIKSYSGRTGTDGKLIQKVTVPTGGEFRAVATVKDGAGRQASAGASVYAWSASYVNWPRTNSDRMEIVADKPEYTIGDTAKLLVKSPYQGEGVKALVTVEREQILRRQVIDITSNAQSIDIPVTADMLPDAYVSVVVVKPRMGETFDDLGQDTGVPGYKVGYAKLNVETSTRKLDLSVTTDKERYLPGEAVNVTIVAKDSTGTPVQADVSLAVVDMSVLALAGFEMPDPVAKFFADRGLGVRTAQMLTYILERYKPGSKGGGGGGPETKTRGNFKDTAYWNPSITTDAQGRATLSFTLPDDLTTWHFLAIADTKDHKFGAKSHTIVETKNVIVRPVQPRFGVHGDTMKIGAIVLNDLPEARDFTVMLSGSGFDAVGSLRQSVRVEPKEQKKVEFEITAKTAASMTLRTTAETQGARDEILHTLPLYPFVTLQSVATAGMIDDTIIEHIYPPAENEATGVKLLATVSPTVATYLPKGLEYVTTFPYGCAEQTISSFLPNVAVSQLQGFEAFQIVDKAMLKDRIEAGLQTLYGYQRGDGGFGYWQGSYRSYAYLTAYIVFGLNEAKDAGYTVDRDVLARATEYLNGRLRSTDPYDPIDLPTRAYILFVLAESGKGDAGLQENLYADWQKLPLFSRAQLAMAFQKTGNAKRANAMVDDLLANVRIDPRGAHFEEAESTAYDHLMHTNTRTTAFVLQALIRIRPDDSIMPRVVRHLLSVREDGHWDTTQSTTMSILALVDYVRHTGELDADFTATLSMSGEELLKTDFDKDNVLNRVTKNLSGEELVRGRDNALEIAKDGKGVLYYDLLLSYYLQADRLPAFEQGLGIDRTVEPVSGAPKDATVGNTYKVTLTITVPQDRHFVAVESPLPAGMEGIDLALKTTQQNLYGDEYEGSQTGNGDPWAWWWDGEEDQLRHFTHREMRDDGVFLFADLLPAGVYTYEYLARATTPGTYKLRPARVYQMYFPEVFGQSAGETVTIR